MQVVWSLAAIGAGKLAIEVIIEVWGGTARVGAPVVPQTVGEWLWAPLGSPMTSGAALIMGAVLLLTEVPVPATARQAYREVLAWRRDHRHMPELAPIFEAIDAAAEQFGHGERRVLRPSRPGPIAAVPPPAPSRPAARHRRRGRRT
jgi:hypothetical protein